MFTQMDGKAVLVTGAAGGIGKETALAFARLGADIFFCDTNPEGIRTTVAAIKALGIAARAEIEAFLERPVVLTLFVRVVPGWRRDARALRRMGFMT